jgi:hypothetical protein
MPHGIKDLIEQIAATGPSSESLDGRVAPGGWAERPIVVAIDAAGKATSRPNPLLVDDIRLVTLEAHRSARGERAQDNSQSATILNVMQEEQNVSTEQETKSLRGPRSINRPGFRSVSDWP